MFFPGPDGGGDFSDFGGFGGDSGLGSDGVSRRTTSDIGSARYQHQFREINDKVQRLMLLNQALWELLRQRLNLRDEELEALVNEIDMRDGVADGRVSETPVRCPTCNRVNNSKHAQCIYCGQVFEKGLFG